MEPLRIPVVVESVGPEYTARCRHPIPAEAAGISRFDARQNLERLLTERLGRPVEVLPLHADHETPWVATAGTIPDDALTDDWLESIAEYRQQFDPPADIPTPTVDHAREPASGVAP